MKPNLFAFAIFTTFVLARSTYTPNPAPTTTATSGDSKLLGYQNVTYSNNDSTKSKANNNKKRPTRKRRPFFHVGANSTVIMPGQTQTLTGSLFSGSEKYSKVVLESFDLAPQLLSIAGANNCAGIATGSTKIRCQWEDLDADSNILLHISITLRNDVLAATSQILEVPLNLTFFTQDESTGQPTISYVIEKVISWTFPYSQADPSQFRQPRAITVSALPSAEYEKLRLRQNFLLTDFHSTGFYLNGEHPLHITVSGVGATGPKPSILVGTPELIDPNYPKMVQEDSLASFGPFDNGNHTITHQTGGIIYIRYVYNPDQENMPDPVVITLAEGNAAQPFPHFREGITTNEEWKSMLAQTTIPFAELDGKRVIITGLAVAAERHARHDPDKLLDTYKYIIATQDKISALSSTAPDPKNRPSPLRPIVVQSNTEMTANSWHYRIAFNGKWEEEIWLQRRLFESWTMWHELGHQRQHSLTWSWDNLNEVTVDIYSLAVRRLPEVPHFSWELDFLHSEKVAIYLNLPIEQRDYDHKDMDLRVKQAMFEQLRLAFGGDEFFHKLHTISRATTLTNITTSADKKHFFMTQASNIFGRDLTAYFTAWGLRPEQRTIDEMNSHPKPTQDYTKVPIKFQRTK